jgi:hypothetical protein
LDICGHVQPYSMSNGHFICPLDICFSIGHVWLIHGWAYYTWVHVGLIYGRHLVLVIIFIAPVNYTVNEKRYKHTVYNQYIKQVG